MNDAALLEAIRAIVRDEVQRALRRDTLAPAPRRLAALLPRLYAPCEPFTTQHVLELARLSVAARVELAEVLRRDFAGDVRRVGIALRQISDAGHVVEDLRLVALPAEAGSRRWELQRVESR